MFRLLKALSLTLALASLSFFTASCGSSSSAQIRVVHAISDGQALDVELNGTKIFTDMPFDSFQPSSGYTKVASGSDTILALDTGTTTQVLSSSASLGGSAQYTVVLSGFQANASAALITDTNTAPASGNIAFRIIDASLAGPGTVDAYIVPPGTDITNVTPQISALSSNTQASAYVPIAFATGGYAVIVTANGNKTPIINQTYIPPTGSIRTLVLLDIQGGGAISQFPLELSDLN
jgi:hypothetical protein